MEKNNQESVILAGTMIDGVVQERQTLGLKAKSKAK